MGSSPRLALQAAENSQRQLLACVLFSRGVLEHCSPEQSTFHWGEGNSPQCRRGGSLSVLTGCSALEWPLRRAGNLPGERADGSQGAADFFVARDLSGMSVGGCTCRAP